MDIRSQDFCKNSHVMMGFLQPFIQVTVEFMTPRFGVPLKILPFFSKDVPKGLLVQCNGRDHSTTHHN